MNAISLYAKPSASFAQKLEASKALLLSAAAQYSPLTQASSLGAEDMVVTHLMAEIGIAASIFVLDTRMLHAQTLALVGLIDVDFAVVAMFQPPDECQCLRVQHPRVEHEDAGGNAGLCNQMANDHVLGAQAGGLGQRRIVRGCRLKQRLAGFELLREAGRRFGVERNRVHQKCLLSFFKRQ